MTSVLRVPVHACVLPVHVHFCALHAAGASAANACRDMALSGSPAVVTWNWQFSD
jgi:hypothetical protein